jgi:hypothetical protein
MPPARTRGGPAAPGTAPPRSDVYTGLLVLSLVAMIGGGVLLWMDLQQYEGSKPPPLPPNRPQAGAPGAPGAPGVPNPPPNQPPGPMPPGPGVPNPPPNQPPGPMPPGPGGGVPKPPGG